MRENCEKRYEIASRRDRLEFRATMQIAEIAMRASDEPQISDEPNHRLLTWC